MLDALGSWWQSLPPLEQGLLMVALGAAVGATNTPRAQAYLTQRVQALLGPDAPVEVRYAP
ncbi:hypothetical protein [Actinomyces wuliandei]|uniref:hypothetical protein n=1 Tax=Actinomyces wuliandei TaxID=2057743 RepID=UPI000FD7D926|nr:hypothetical protein [Actinomyces wuliandei]